MGGEIEYFNPPADDSIYNFVRVPDDQLFHAVRITGPVQLVGRLVDAENVRAGAALAIAGLIAKGTTTITNIYQIDRGYEDFGGRLARLGATIERIGTV
jgi:UDP-N-acetylglucosamine enolpyruvyl transferase